LTRQQGLRVPIVFHSNTHPIRMLTNKNGVPENDEGVGYKYMPIGLTSELFTGVEIPCMVHRAHSSSMHFAGAMGGSCLVFSKVYLSKKHLAL
jgi:hypothetical protein